MSFPSALNNEGEDFSNAEDVIIRIIEVISPIKFYYISKAPGWCIARLVPIFGPRATMPIWSMLLHLIILRDQFFGIAQFVVLKMQHRYLTRRVQHDVVVHSLPMEELNDVATWLSSIFYQIFWWYNLHVAGGPLPVLSWAVSHFTNPLKLCCFFAIVIGSQKIISGIRGRLSLTLHGAVWLGYPLIHPLEFWISLGAEERRTVWNNSVILIIDIARWTLLKICLLLPALSEQSIAVDREDPEINDYIFEPLDSNRREIRLLCVQKKSYVAPATCTLINVPLQHAPAYEAVSYTWDGQDIDQAILLGESRLLVTQNARKIIENRASTGRVRWLWIDAICINQGDDLEKSMQVSMMGQIYRSAAMVTIWLENREATLSDALLVCALLGAFQRKVFSSTASDRQKVEDLGNCRMWRALDRFITHDYWFRVWIIQEIAQASSLQIVYGGVSMSGAALEETIIKGILNGPFRQMSNKCVLLSGGDYWRQFSGMLQLSYIAKCAALVTSKKTLDLTEILSTMLHAESKDPRDQIFGIYSIIECSSLTSDMLEDFKPNYSITPRVLFLNVAIRLLQQEPNFVFNRAGIGYQTRSLQLPSWVPDWSENRDDQNVVATKHESEILRDFRGADFRYRAGGSNLLSYEIHQGEMLQLQGIVIGCISEISNKLFPSSSIIKSMTDPGLMKSTIQSFRDFGCGMREYHDAIIAIASRTPEVYGPTGQSRTEAVWRTIIGDRVIIELDHQIIEGNCSVEDGFPAPQDVSVLYDAWCKWLPVDKESDFGSCDGKEEVFGIILDNNRSKGYFAITTNGFMVTLPPRAMRGDEIYVVPGLSKPIVVRPMKRRTNGSMTLRPSKGQSDGDFAHTWEFVGECYVHGLMRGEIFTRKHKLVPLLTE